MDALIQNAGTYCTGIVGVVALVSMLYLAAKALYLGYTTTKHVASLAILLTGKAVSTTALYLSRAYPMRYALAFISGSAASGFGYQDLHSASLESQIAPSQGSAAILATGIGLMLCSALGYIRYLRTPSYVRVRAEDFAEAIKRDSKDRELAHLYESAYVAGETGNRKPG